MIEPPDHPKPGLGDENGDRARQDRTTEGEAPLLTISARERAGPIVWITTLLWRMVGRRLARIVYGLQPVDQRAEIDLYADSITVRFSWEGRFAERELRLEDVRRIEFHRPDTVLLGFGLTSREQTNHVAVTLSPMVAEDKFDILVEHMEEACGEVLFSIRNRLELWYSREWTMDELFEHVETVDRAVIEACGEEKWTIATEVEKYAVELDQGLLLYPESEDGPRIQVLHSVVLHRIGVALASVECNRKGELVIAFGTGLTLVVHSDGLLTVGAKPVGSIVGDPIMLREATGWLVATAAMTREDSSAVALRGMAGMARVRLAEPLPEPIVLVALLVFLARGGEIPYR